MKTALVMYYARPNRFSINPLIGVLEARADFKRLSLYFPTDAAQLRRAVRLALRRNDRVAVGFSYATPQVWSISPLAAGLRERFKDRLFLIAGGPHPTADPEGALRAGFDLVVRGEGEETLAEILKGLQAGGDGKGVAGAVWQDARGRCRSGGIRPPVDLDAVPPFAPGHRLFGPIEITRGCPFACRFCQTSQLFGRKPRHRSPAVVARYAGLLAARDMRDVRFITPNAFSYGSPDGRSVDLEAVRELLAKVREAQGPSGRIFFGTMPSEVRPEHVSAAALRLIREYAANDNLVIGAQSGSQRVLDACGRGHTVADIAAAVAATRKAGLKANVDFIFGLPGETEVELEATIVLIRRLVPMGARIHAHSFVPLPQTGFAGRRRAPMPARLGAMLDRLTTSGAIYGQWKEQERIAARIEGSA